MRAIFPEILKRNSIWDGTHHDELERFLAYDPGVFLGGQLSALGADTLFRRIGLPVLYTSSETDKDWDDMCFSAARLETALVGNPERGEALIASYKQAFVDLEQELRPETFGVEPRVLMMASSAPGQREFLGALRDGNLYDLYVYRAGLKNAASGWAGVQLVDVERILAMDPDMIFLTAGMPIDQGPKEFMIDPRWRGLKAVQEKRVYLMVGWLDGLDLQQFWTRWMAELAHPDRLQPKFREMLSDHFVKEFGYRLSDEQIDQFLHINENKDQSGYARFRRSQQADDGRSSSQ
ncbi:MAG TPA: ABC transporter substrate-binding protein [Methylocella sp.]|nr:ABC transporter substrate-binding protein [Methylocella sp.]